MKELIRKWKNEYIENINYTKELYDKYGEEVQKNKNHPKFQEYHKKLQIALIISDMLNDLKNEYEQIIDEFIKY